VASCTILVTAANALIASIHDRMPVILAPEDRVGTHGAIESRFELLSRRIRLDCRLIGGQFCHAFAALGLKACCKVRLHSAPEKGGFCYSIITHYKS